MRNWIYILVLLIITSCSNSGERKIIYNKIWIEKNNLMTASFDTSGFILDDFNYNYKLSKDLLTIWVVNNVEDSLVSFAEDTILFKVKHIDNDSLILTDLSIDTEITYGKNLRFYSKKILYDTSIYLKSITFEKGLYDGDYQSEVITLLKDTIFLRADSGIVEIEPNRFVNKMIDFNVSINDSVFNIIEDLIRCSNIEQTDTIYEYPFSSHIFWTVSISYNDKIKKIKGNNLPPSFYTIWFNLMKMAHDYEFEMIKEHYSVGWKRN